MTDKTLTPPDWTTWVAALEERLGSQNPFKLWLLYLAERFRHSWRIPQSLKEIREHIETENTRLQRLQALVENLPVPNNTFSGQKALNPNDQTAETIPGRLPTDATRSWLR